ncbi:NB-ARC domain-containing protein [Abeliophyllum distichum]|uniref:NB-ARC domain-containing protein n=1 Tax=Abeliophyllum distichum TaxID=126358 RepID=A0ABD1V6S2_9LAMI
MCGLICTDIFQRTKVEAEYYSPLDSKKLVSRLQIKALFRNLRFLTDDECWKLLQMKVFHDVPCPLELVDIGMNIARNCHGLPLAVVVIAAVLANMKKNKTNWEEVAESSSTHISKDNSCMKILELSYNYLPMHLKPCFLYFGAFAEATEIPVQKLTSLWVAEGFVERVKHKNSNLVSYGYLTDLISRGLVLVGKRRSDGGVKTCYVHDLLREMCLTIAEKDNFMKVIQDQLPIYVPHHRLSILSSSITPFSRPFGLHVRSLLGYLPEPSRFIFSNMELVKTQMQICICCLPLNLRKLTLTKLKLNSNEMKMIGELQKLEVLKLESASIEDNEWNPNEGEFQQLRFLKLRNMGVVLKVSSDHFPRLEQLVLTRFRTAIPSSLGDIPTLVKIEVKWCTNEVEESALKILEEQQDNGNELLKVKIVGLNKLRTLMVKAASVLLPIFMNLIGF